MTENITAVTRDFESDSFLFFKNPIKIIEIYDPGLLIPALSEVEALTNNGFWCLGFISYEAAECFDSNLNTLKDPKFPKLWFAIFDQAAKGCLGEPRQNFFLGKWKPEITRQNYEEAVAVIRKKIKRGDTYQCNYTFQLETVFEGEALDCFRSFVKKQSSPYATYLQTGQFCICSASPELFFQREAGKITTKPMKGTAARGQNEEEDQKLASALSSSAKEQAENIMIVDLLRNDLSRIAEPASVKTESLYDLQKLETVWQMTSTVNARTCASDTDILKALFPCASVTGAPKKSTMDIITETEKSPRKVYTGAICVFSPEAGGKVRSSVPIRTILLDIKNKQASYGVGSGITWDSNEASEYCECLLKAEATPSNYKELKLLETMLFERDKGIFLLDPHLKRLESSAVFFNFHFDAQTVESKLLDFCATTKEAKAKVRLLLDCNGHISCELLDFPENKIFRLGLAREAIDSTSIFIKHKTSNRSVYEKALRDKPDCDDCILWNINNQLCETCIGNLAYKIEGRWYTPPEDVGILCGIYRQYLLESGQISERQLLLDQIGLVEEFAVLNSVRGWVHATLAK